MTKHEGDTTTPNPLATGAKDEMPRVLLMRHAQTHANSQGFFLGRRDEGVTALGEEQSRRAVEGSSPGVLTTSYARPSNAAG